MGYHNSQHIYIYKYLKNNAFSFIIYKIFLKNNIYIMQSDK